MPHGPLWRKHAGRPGKGQNGQKSAWLLACCFKPGQLRPIGFHLLQWRPRGTRADESCGAFGKEQLRGGWAIPNITGDTKSAATAQATGPGMQDDQDKRAGKTGPGVKDSRHQRLKLALRENLKRRKSQARGRSDEVAVSTETEDASLNDAGGEKPGQ